MEPTTEIKLSDFAEKEFIADGTFSKVYKVTHAPTGKVYAMKRCSKEALMTLKVQDRDTFQYLDGIDLVNRETHVIKLVKEHPDMAADFPNFIFGYQDDEAIYIIMEFSRIGPLLNFDHKKACYIPNPKYEQFRLAELKQTYLQMARSLSSLHRLKVAHMDVKIENFLVFEELTGQRHVKLLDFNTSKIFEEKEPKTSNQYGTIFYLPPEYYESIDGYNPFLADVYALGVCFFILATMKLPYTASKDPENEPFQDVVYESNISSELVYLGEIPEELQNLLGAMLTKEPEERLTASEVVHTLLKMLSAESK